MKTGVFVNAYERVRFGAEARAAGELFLDDVDGELMWFVNVSSGRYCRFDPPTKQQTGKILDLFRSIIDPDVQLDDISEG